VHFPQFRAIGGLGMPLLDWLNKCALPEESRLADRAYARAVAAEFLDGLIACGTTSALVFGSHFAAAMEELFAAAERRGLNITSGLVLSDRRLRPDLLHTPEGALAESADLIGRWHDRGRLRYAVTPRFSLSASEEMLEVCAQLLGKGVWFTTHINENAAEIKAVTGLFPRARSYLDTYCRPGLVTERSVFAHNVHPGDAELAALAERGAAVAHCPTSNCALGSGLFPLRRHVERGIGVALGSDVGAGAGLFMPKEALQAYFVQQLLGPGGMSLTPVHLLYLATRAGARALGLDGQVGDFATGKDFDAVWLRPAPGSALSVNLTHACDAEDALARVFALATPADVAGVWLRGRRVAGMPLDPGQLPRAAWCPGALFRPGSQSGPAGIPRGRRPGQRPDLAGDCPADPVEQQACLGARPRHVRLQLAERVGRCYPGRGQLACGQCAATSHRDDRDTPASGGPGHPHGCLSGQALRIQRALTGDDQVGAGQRGVEAHQVEDESDARAWFGAQHGQRREPHAASRA
jgi:guanine deaminase